MRILFQGHRATRASTNQSLWIKDEPRCELSGAALTSDRSLIDMLSVHVLGWEPVEDVRLRSRCLSDTCVGVLQSSPSPLMAFGFATFQRPFDSFLGFLTYCRYGNEWTAQMWPEAKEIRQTYAVNFPCLSCLVIRAAGSTPSWIIFSYKFLLQSRSAGNLPFLWL